jgi:hypothetical protein
MFDNGVKVSSDLRMIRLINGQTIVVNKYIELDFKNGKLDKKINIINPNGRLSMIYVKYLNEIIVFDDRLYNAFFIQMYLENYDHTLYEKIFSTPRVRMYRLK